jgi:hypothetical protein
MGPGFFAAASTSVGDRIKKKTHRRVDESLFMVGRSYYL